MTSNMRQTGNDILGLLADRAFVKRMFAYIFALAFQIIIANGIAIIFNVGGMNSLYAFASGGIITSTILAFSIKTIYDYKEKHPVLKKSYPFVGLFALIVAWCCFEVIHYLITGEMLI